MLSFFLLLLIYSFVKLVQSLRMETFTHILPIKQSPKIVMPSHVPDQHSTKTWGPIMAFVIPNGPTLSMCEALESTKPGMGTVPGDL